MDSLILLRVQQRIKEQEHPNQIIELNLEQLSISILTPPITHHLRQLPNLQILILRDNDLCNIDPLPPLPLTVLDITNNKINEQALLHISLFTQLRQLTLSFNQIKSLQSLQALCGLKNLLSVDFSQNIVSDQPDYRAFVFKCLPSIQLLDQLDQNGQEPSEDMNLSSDEEDHSSFQNSSQQPAVQEQQDTSKE